jgi:hypothetical protein
VELPSKHTAKETSAPRNARWTPAGRPLLCQRIEAGWPVTHAGAASWLFGGSAGRPISPVSWGLPASTMHAVLRPHAHQT